MEQVAASSPDLAAAATEGQVSNPDPGGKPAVRQTAKRKDSMGPPTLWQQRQLAKDPLSPVLDGRLVGKSRTSEVSAPLNVRVGLPVLCHK